MPLNLNQFNIINLKKKTAQLSGYLFSLIPPFSLCSRAKNPLSNKKEKLVPEQLLGFFIAFFPFFSSSKSESVEIDQNLDSEKKVKKTKLSKKKFDKILYEEIGLFPRSLSRVFFRFVTQLFYDVENLVLQEYRFYRYLFLTTIKSIFIIILVPFLVNLLVKNFIVRPLTEYLWNTKQSQIFLNASQQNHAFAELKYFEEKLYFESLVFPGPPPKILKQTELSLEESCCARKATGDCSRSNMSASSTPDAFLTLLYSNLGTLEKVKESTLLKESTSIKKTSRKKSRIAALQVKTVELAMTYNKQSIEAITNFVADLISVITFLFLLVAMEIPINISKSFLLEVFFGLDDSRKSFLILLVTDLLVGYHSDGPWAIFFESLFNHYGLPESQVGVFLFVATLPVLLDVLFKYLIFRHLNRASPSTVATYHAMIE